MPLDNDSSYAVDSSRGAYVGKRSRSPTEQARFSECACVYVRVCITFTFTHGYVHAVYYQQHGWALCLCCVPLAVLLSCVYGGIQLRNKNKNKQCGTR